MARMTHASIKSLLALALLTLGAAVVAGCGSDELSSGAVAKVGDEEISQEEFDKWLRTSISQQSPGGEVVVPDPPDFTKCVAGKKKVPLPEGQKQQSDVALKKQCEQEYDTLRRETMLFLIQAEWVEQEAEERGIEVSDASVRKSLEDQKKQAFPNEKAYNEFIKSSGMTEEDILYRVRLNELQQKLTQKVTEDATKVTDEDIQEYYDKNKERFAQPERRDLRVVLTKTEAKADQARGALEDGDAWKQVVKEYSIDPASKAQGGLLPAVAEGQQDKALDEAVFGAKKGELEGPVKTQFGWYVFEVEKITPASQQSLEQSKDTIRNLLRSERQQKALDEFVKDFREDYREKTECADDYRIEECSNAPKGGDDGPVSGGNPSGPTPQDGQPAPTPTPEPPPEQ
jgi:parvulin-like peptidyl-prolyl isomerase